MKTVQMILRHADVRTTANVYGHLLSSSLDEVGERLSAFLQSRHAKGTSSSLVREHSNDPVKPAPSEGFVVVLYFEGGQVFTFYSHPSPQPVESEDLTPNLRSCTR